MFHSIAPSGGCQTTRIQCELIFKLLIFKAIALVKKMMGERQLKTPSNLLFCCHCCCLVTKLFLILWDPTDCSLPDSSVYGISQARILEWVTISFFRGSSQPRDWTHVSCIFRQILYLSATREADYWVNILHILYVSWGYKIRKQCQGNCAFEDVCVCMWMIKASSDIQPSFTHHRLFIQLSYP